MIDILKNILLFIFYVVSIFFVLFFDFDKNNNKKLFNVKFTFTYLPAYLFILAILLVLMCISSFYAFNLFFLCIIAVFFALFFVYSKYKNKIFLYLEYTLNYLPVYLFIVTILLIIKTTINSYTFRSHKYHPPTRNIEYIYNTLYDVTIIPYFLFWHVTLLWFIALIIKYFKYKEAFQVNRVSKIIFWVTFVVMFYLDFFDWALGWYW